MDIELSRVRQTFITESSELLVEMENSLLRLEKSPEDQDVINSLFRSAHTIKGSSGIVGMENVEKFTHVVESLLTKVRDNGIKITNKIIELLLECRDHISSLIELAAAETEAVPPGTAEKDALLTGRLNEYLGNSMKLQKTGAAKEAQDSETEGRCSATPAWHISLRFGENVLRSGMDPISFLTYLAKLGEVISLTTLCNMPPAEEMDPETCYMGFEIDLKSDFDKKTIEDVFEFVREDCTIHILPPYSKIDSYIELIKGLPEESSLLGELLIKGGVLTQAELDEALSIQSRQAEEGEGKKRLIGEILVDGGMVHAEVLEAALEKQKNVQTAKTREASTIRIDAGKLDQLINLVGELVISSANMEQHSQRIKDPSLLESASIMMRLVEDIRDNTMKIRMVPIGETFSRFNRVVRDISRDFGKDMELVVSGGETELDKTVIEKIADPLMHLVRNAADHGIEMPSVRTGQGKPPKGTIHLNAYHDAGSIMIELCDDGKGLDRNKILEKAVKRGLVAQGQNITDSELFSLIFEPGFSTAEQVTKLSGRGVGMDVVRRNIEALRGTVDVESSAGKGTTVRIRLPLTLAIIDGFMVGVNRSFYVIPLEMVVECVELPETERHIEDNRSYINLRGEVLPYIRLRNYFGEHGEEVRYENIVIAQYAGQKIGLVVEELFGEVQTVIKSLGKVYKDVKGISGATIMGNGKVALILDIPRLMQTVELDMAV